MQKYEIFQVIETGELLLHACGRCTFVSISKLDGIFMARYPVVLISKLVVEKAAQCWFQERSKHPVSLISIYSLDVYSG